MKIFFSLLGAAIVAALIYAGYLWATTDHTVPEAQEVTVSGVYECLPHADTNGPQTLECAFGIRTTDGDHYALDTAGLTNGSVGDLSVDDEITVTGTVTAREDIPSGDRLLTYDIAGVIHATTITAADQAADAVHVLPGGRVQFTVPPDFGLAVTKDQVLVSGVIPPCNEGFDYCLYYNNPQFEQTNFEAAGFRINERADIASKEACLTAQPEGYADLVPGTNEADAYATSIFTPVSDAGAGHVASGSVYRLFTGNTCYEFESRIGTTQYANYEPGTITEFTEADRATVAAALDTILKSIRLTDNPTVSVF
jgi:hypothetical protein